MRLSESTYSMGLRTFSPRIVNTFGNCGNWGPKKSPESSIFSSGNHKMMLSAPSAPGFHRLRIVSLQSETIGLTVTYANVGN